MAEGTPTPRPAGSSGGQPAAPLRDFAEIAVERGYCSAQQIAQARAGQPPGVALRLLLVQKGVISEDQARACERATRGVTRLAGFEILEKIGQGGMGAVFRARQTSMDRIVALKILPPKLAQDPSFKQRFLQEAQISAKLSHLNIISGIDCGDSGGFTYFAMEFVDGKTVKQILKEREKLPYAEAFSIVRQVAEALVYAESKGMVHRDIKPDNIMLTKDGKAKLCDLGLAKQQHDDTNVTQAGQALGTPNYISPEQARGESNVDTRADIYSLGATFYHLLSGNPPFAAPTGASVMALHISEEARSPCDSDPLLPTSYGQIISKMMAKSPGDRYANARQLVGDLEAAQQKLMPTAATFRAKSSCALPRRATKPEAHEAHAGEMAPLEPLPADSATGLRKAVSSRAGLALAALGLLVVLGATGYWIWGLHGSGQVAQVQPGEPDRPAAQNHGTGEPKALAAVKPEEPEPKAKTQPAEQPKVEPKTVPEAPAKAPAPAPKNPEPPPATPEPPAKVPEPTPAPTKTPVATPKPEEVQISKAKTDTAEEEAPPPKVASTPDMLYARFLGEFKKPSAKGELRKFQEELKELAAKTEFDVARADVNADLDDLAKAVVFEQEAVKAMAAAGGSFELNEEIARKWQAKKGKIVGFDPARGMLMVELMNGMQLPIGASTLSFADILKHAPDKSPAAQLRYLAARGYHAEAAAIFKAQGASFKPELLARWERKLRLLASGELELRAEATFEILRKVAEAKHWRTFTTLADDFDKSYGNTSAATEHVAELLQWKAASRLALSPPEGLEATGKFNPVKWPKTNACEVQVVADRVMGNKLLRIEGKTEASLLGEGDKSVVMRSNAPPLNLEGKTKLVFRARHAGKTALAVAVGFFFGQFYESQLVAVPAGGWAELSIPIDGAVFKSQRTNYLNFDTELPSSVAQSLLILIYTKEPYVLEIAGIALR